MDALLERLGVQAFNFAVRSGLAITSSIAISQCTRLLKAVDDREVYVELKALQKLLDSKIKIVSPVIDLIEFKAGRGNICLENALPLVRSLHRDIVALGQRLEAAASAEEDLHSHNERLRATTPHHADLKLIITDIKDVLSRIDRDIPALQLAVTSSGVTMSTSMPPGVSPSRFLQASAFLIYGDTQFAVDPRRPVQVGPSFTLSLYMLFLGHSKPVGENAQAASTLPSTPARSIAGSAAANEPYGFRDAERKPIWQEVAHKARVRLCRTPSHWIFDKEQGFCPSSSPHSDSHLDSSGEEPPQLNPPGDYSYHIEMVEDMDDGRLHEEDPHLGGSPFDDILRAGLRESIPVHQISKIFYTDTGRILNIGNADDGGSNPVLLLKRDLMAPTPSNLRQEWLAEQNFLQEQENEEIGTHSLSNVSDGQDDVDKQLRQESEQPWLQNYATKPREWSFPQHLDPEWLALEVFAEDDTDDEESDEDLNVDGSESRSGTPEKLSSAKPRIAADRTSVDSKLLAQIRSISLRSSPPSSPFRSGSRNLPAKSKFENPDLFVQRSPFGAITSSLSLMEMLIRLTSLQSFQQASHLTIPDHILTFFLEETSTTGLRGEERWKARNEAKRRVGFDPYTDTPAN